MSTLGLARLQGSTEWFLSSAGRLQWETRPLSFPQKAEVLVA